MNDNVGNDSFILLNAAPRHERADAAANRQLILETAAQLIAAQGSEQVTMADIATAAGVGKGTLYRRFSSKGDLALALMHEQMTAFQEESLGELRRATLVREPYLTQLEGFLMSLVSFVEQHLPLLCVVQQEGLLQTGRAHPAPYFWQHQTVSGLLGRAKRNGELSEEIDVLFMADALLAPLRVDVYRLQRETRGFSLERIRDGMRSLVAALAVL